MSELPVAEELAMANECLYMVEEVLAAYLPMQGCPPMFYDNAIQQLVWRSFKAGVHAVYREQGRIPTQADLERLAQPAHAFLQHFKLAPNVPRAVRRDSGIPG